MWTLNTDRHVSASLDLLESPFGSLWRKTGHPRRGGMTKGEGRQRQPWAFDRPAPALNWRSCPFTDQPLHVHTGLVDADTTMNTVVATGLL